MSDRKSILVIVMLALAISLTATPIVLQPQLTRGYRWSASHSALLISTTTYPQTVNTTSSIATNLTKVFSTDKRFAACGLDPDTNQTECSYRVHVLYEGPRQLVLESEVGFQYDPIWEAVALAELDKYKIDGIAPYA